VSDTIKVDLSLYGSLALGRLDRLTCTITRSKSRGLWQTDLFALLEQRGYTVLKRGRQNVACRCARA